jgi:hypothetical protein
MRSRCRTAWPKLSAVVLLLSASCACVTSAGSQKDTPAPVPRATIAGAELVAGYKGWTRVNPEPAVFHSKIAIQCYMPPPEQLKLEREQNPHRDKFVTVYVNDAGRRAMLEERSPRFPVGSLVVKEKLPARDSKEPELLTAMLKHEAGYDPEGGDWEYFVLDGRGTELRARGKLETCRACHQLYPHTDFVARNYLPYELFQKLK